MRISATSPRLLRRSLYVADMRGVVAPFVVSRLTPMFVGPVIVIGGPNAIEASATTTATHFIDVRTSGPASSVT